MSTDIQYSFKKTEPEGDCSGIYWPVSLEDKEELKDADLCGLETLCDLFLNSAEVYSKDNFLGSREIIEFEDQNSLQIHGQENDSKLKTIYGDYHWKTFNEVLVTAKRLSLAIHKEGLATPVSFDDEEVKDLRMIGIHSKNREEWVITDIACMYDSVVTVPLYDTLGPHIIDFISGQTKF